MGDARGLKTLVLLLIVQSATRLLHLLKLCLNTVALPMVLPVALNILLMTVACVPYAARIFVVGYVSSHTLATCVDLRVVTRF